MIIFGSGSASLGTQKYTPTACPHCHTEESLVFSAFRKHAHVFWIPMFPIGKKGHAQCLHCKAVMPPHEMPDSFRKDYYTFLNQTKGPAWQYIGLLLLVALLGIAIWSVQDQTSKELEYLQNPQAGDVYGYELDLNAYSTLKIERITADSLFMSPNLYEISKRHKISRIDLPKNYADFTEGYSKEEIKNMYQTGVIFKISRTGIFSEKSPSD